MRLEACIGQLNGPSHFLDLGTFPDCERPTRCREGLAINLDTCINGAKVLA